MTRLIRENKRYEFIQQNFNNSTSILDKKTQKMSNWNTGYEAEEEKEFLISGNDDAFNKYCESIINAV